MWPKEKLGRRRASRLNSTTSNAAFVPDVQVIPAGPLDVVNKDPVLHNTHGYYGKRTAFNMALAESRGSEFPPN